MLMSRGTAVIKADGWRLERTNGSHYQYRHPTKPGEPIAKPEKLTMDN
jgi:predicted RNA binding protein YcfA (HicA-like mRNA interferase family)